MDGVYELIQGLEGAPVYAAIFGLLIVTALGVPISEDLILIAAGFACFAGAAVVHMMLPVCLAGMLLGDAIVYGMGAFFGRPLLEKRFFRRLVNPARIESIKAGFHKYGPRIILGARFVPGVRFPTWITAGMLHVPFRTFLLFDAIAACVMAPLYLYTVYAFGRQIIDALQSGQQIIIALVVLIVLFYLIRWLWNRFSGAGDSPADPPDSDGASG